MARGARRLEILHKSSEKMMFDRSRVLFEHHERGTWAVIILPNMARHWRDGRQHGPLRVQHLLLMRVAVRCVSLGPSFICWHHVPGWRAGVRQACQPLHEPGLDMLHVYIYKKNIYTVNGFLRVSCFHLGLGICVRSPWLTFNAAQALNAARSVPLVRCSELWHGV